MRVVLSAYIGSHNLGDEAIAEVVISNLEKDQDLELAVLSRNVSKTKNYANGKKTVVYKNSTIELIKQLRRSDCLLLGGGGIIQDDSSVLNLIYFYQQIWWARIFKKPVYLVFVGVGPIKTGLGKLLMRRLATKVKFSVVRDQESADTLVKYGFGKQAILVAYDPVFNFPYNPAKNKSQNPYILFCPRDWFFSSKYLPAKQALKAAKRKPGSDFYKYRESLLNTVQELLTNHPNLEVLAVPFFFTQDSELINWIGDRLDPDLKSRFKIIHHEITVDEYMALAQSAKAIWGVRLHSLILGAAVKKPLAAIAYVDKVANLVRYLELDQYSTPLVRPDFDTKSVAKKVELATSSPAPYIDKIAKIQSVNQQAFSRLLGEIKG